MNQAQIQLIRGLTDVTPQVFEQQPTWNSLTSFTNEAYMNRFCFISYKHHDDDILFLKELIERLKNANIEYWYDYHIQSGRGWEEFIDEKLIDAAVIIVIVSPNSVKSQYVTYEWAFGRGYSRGEHIKKLIIPLILDRPIYDKREIHPALVKHQALFFTGNSDTWPWDKLIDDIQAFFGEMATRPPEELLPLINGLNTGDRTQILSNIASLERSDSDGAITALRQALRHHDPYVRNEAAMAVSRVSKNHDPAVIPQLRTIVEDGRYFEYQEPALRILGDLGADGASECGEILFDALKKPQTHLKVSAIRALGHMKYLPSRNTLLTLLDNFNVDPNSSANYDLAREAADALGLLGDDSTAPALQKVLGRVYAMGTDMQIYSVLGALSRMGRKGVRAITEVTFGIGVTDRRLTMIVDALDVARKSGAATILQDLDSEYEVETDTPRKALLDTLRKKLKQRL